MNKPTVILGASNKPKRYSYLATQSLKKHGHTVFPLGLRQGAIEGTTIINDKPILQDIDTITLYLSPQNQKEWYNYILQVHPKRIVFNPGTENPELYSLAVENGIECTIACTLVLLSIGDY
jgi:uncharacterized protein